MKQKIIFHIDGDAFFASCEQSTNMRLRGKPVAVGAERGIVTAFSYEAKRLGVTRALSAIMLRQQFPEVLLVHSDYRKYSLFSERMIAIVRQYTDDIEYASIDECYADMTREVQNYASVEVFAKALQEELCIKLGLTVSIGIGPTKSLAKISSGINKPRGLTIVYPEKIVEVVGALPVRKVSGVGVQTAKMLEKLSVYTVGDFLRKDVTWVSRHGNKTLIELHTELSGTSVWQLAVESETPQSVSKMHTFITPVEGKQILLAKLSEQCEIVGRKLRRAGLVTRSLTFGLICLPNIHEMDKVTVDFDTPTNDPSAFYTAIEAKFLHIYESMGAYRAVSVSTHGRLFRADDILEVDAVQSSLFTLDIPGKRKVEGVLGALLASIPIHRAASLAPLSRLSKAQRADTQPKKSTDKYTAAPLIRRKIGNKILEIPFLGTCT